MNIRIGLLIQWFLLGFIGAAFMMLFGMLVSCVLKMPKVYNESNTWRGMGVVFLLMSLFSFIISIGVLLESFTILGFVWGCVLTMMWLFIGNYLLFHKYEIKE